MKLFTLLCVLIPTLALAQYNEPNIYPEMPRDGIVKELFKTEIQLGGETYFSENLTNDVPFGKENKGRFNLEFKESGIKIGNQEFSAKLMPLTVKLTANGDEKWDESNLKTLAQRIRGEVARFFFQPEGTDLFINVGTIAFDYKKYGPQANHPSGVEVTQMDVADLNIGYRIDTQDGKWQIIFSGYAAVQMVNVHDNDFIDSNSQLLGKNVAGTYGLSVWGNYDDMVKWNISWYHQQSKLANRDFVAGDNLSWDHHSLSTGLELNLGKLIHKKLAPVSLMMKYDLNVATINDKVHPQLKPVQMQQTLTSSFQVGVKITIPTIKKKKAPKTF